MSQPGSSKQKMVDLPEDRLTPAPSILLSQLLEWITSVRFKCAVLPESCQEIRCPIHLSHRAVHIKVAHSLVTDSFLLAFRQFIARRGQVREMRSDNGTNLPVENMSYDSQSKHGITARFPNKCCRTISSGVLAPLMAHTTVEFRNVAFVQCGESCALFFKRHVSKTKASLPLCVKGKVI